VDCLLDAAAFRPGQYLTFRLAGQHLAIRADCVRGILPLHELAVFSEAGLGQAHSAAGFASLGGQGFPVIDLRRKLRIAAPARGREPMIVVLKQSAPEGQLVGFVADRVSGVIDARERDYRHGKLHTSGRPRRVLDPDAIVVSVNS
jgi:chemotaxis signal transduction protein